MKRWRTVFASCVVAFPCAILSVEGRAEQAPVRRAPSGTTASPPASTRPAAPADAPGSRSPAPGAGPVTPGEPGKKFMPKPDYAIAVHKQQETSDGGMLFQFRVDNLGKAPGGPGVVKISVGLPCPGGENWGTLSFPQEEDYSVPALDPGKSAFVPKSKYKYGIGTVSSFLTPHQYLGKGCRFRVEVKEAGGGRPDANPSNNRMHVFTKKFSLPDLVVFMDTAGGGPNKLTVKNIGEAPADPSVALFKCKALTEMTTCGSPAEKRKAELEMEVKVPALSPGQTYKIHSAMPDTSGSVQADRNNDVNERNETNNVYKWGK